LGVEKMYDEMAINYLKSLSKTERKKLIKRIFDSLDDEEKLEVAKIIVES
jgi:uncharacterized protein (DUF2164 family)